MDNPTLRGIPCFLLDDTFQLNGLTVCRRAIVVSEVYLGN